MTTVLNGFVSNAGHGDTKEKSFDNLRIRKRFRVTFPFVWLTAGEILEDVVNRVY